MGQTSKPLFTFWSCWEYFSTLTHSLLQFSEPAPRLAIPKLTARSCLLHSVQSKGSPAPREAAFPQQDAPPHYQRLAPKSLHYFPMSSLTGIHEQVPKHWSSMSEFVCFPGYFRYHNQYLQWLPGFPVCKPCLTWFPFPFHSLFLQLLRITDGQTKTWPYTCIYFFKYLHRFSKG